MPQSIVCSNCRYQALAPFLTSVKHIREDHGKSQGAEGPSEPGAQPTRWWPGVKANSG